MHAPLGTEGPTVGAPWSDEPRSPPLGDRGPRCQALFRGARCRGPWYRRVPRPLYEGPRYPQPLVPRGQGTSAAGASGPRNSKAPGLATQGTSEPECRPHPRFLAPEFSRAEVPRTLGTRPRGPDAIGPRPLGPPGTRPSEGAAHPGPGGRSWTPVPRGSGPRNVALRGRGTPSPANSERHGPARPRRGRTGGGPRLDVDLPGSASARRPYLASTRSGPAAQPRHNSNSLFGRRRRAPRPGLRLRPFSFSLHLSLCRSPATEGAAAADRRAGHPDRGPVKPPAQSEDAAGRLASVWGTFSRWISPRAWSLRRALWTVETDRPTRARWTVTGPARGLVASPEEQGGDDADIDGREPRIGGDVVGQLGEGRGLASRRVRRVQCTWTSGSTPGDHHAPADWTLGLGNEIRPSELSPSLGLFI